VSSPQPAPHIHLSSAESDGQLSLTEMTMPAGAAGPPLHVHPGHAEGFYILEGELVMQVGARRVTGHAGQYFYAPAGAPHAFANRTDRDARLLVTCNPAGFERWFVRSDPAEPPPDSEAVGPPVGLSG
jgi:quercetin dioxygenase-like cupin family protein